MQLIVNGERKDVVATRIEALLGELDFRGTHLAVAVNYEVVPRSQWGDVLLADGDEIEVLTASQGG